MVLKYKNIILYSFILFSIMGILSPYTFNILNVKIYLELIFIIFTILNIKYIKRSLQIYFLISLFYIFYSLFIVLFNDHKIVDYIYIYKIYFYIIFLILLYDRRWLDKNFTDKLFYLLLIVFLIKYSYSLIFGLAHRPGIFIENNFELMFLLLIFIAKLHFEKRVKLKDYLILSLIVGISGSRSAVLSLAIMTLFMNFGNKKIYTYLKFLIIVMIFILSFYIILTRMQNMGIEDIDRVKFLYLFFDEIKEWNFFQYVFGNPPITPLSQNTCSHLIYYKSLFSDIEKNVCYSVVLHSYILRSILDHGIFGLIFVFYFIYKILKISNFKINEILMVLSLLIVNSLSVSSLNSIFAIFGIAILVTLNTRNINANPK